MPGRGTSDDGQWPRPHERLGAWAGSAVAAGPYPVVDAPRPARADDDCRYLAGAQDDIDLRDLRLQFVAITLRQAAGHHQLLASAGLPAFRHLQDGVNRFLLGAVDEGTGVDDDDVRVSGVGGNRVSGSFGQPQHHLAIYEVLGAAQRNHSDLHLNTVSP